MIKKNPETYAEVMALKNVLEITKYYNVSQEFLDAAYDFLMADKTNRISISKGSISFYNASGNNIKSYTADNTSLIDGLVLTALTLTIIPHYTSSSGSGGGGGFSSNNNNNNNH